ncbi:MAG: hypothetical protein KGL04_06400 [Elusimicrobia bacterium]|nr:hypothetical protein [Elusimicrobiota bacterium]
MKPLKLPLAAAVILSLFPAAGRASQNIEATKASGRSFASFSGVAAIKKQAARDFGPTPAAHAGSYALAAPSSGDCARAMTIAVHSDKHSGLFVLSARTHDRYAGLFDFYVPAFYGQRYSPPAREESNVPGYSHSEKNSYERFRGLAGDHFARFFQETNCSPATVDDPAGCDRIKCVFGADFIGDSATLEFSCNSGTGLRCRYARSKAR